MITTTYANHDKKAIHVRNTWAQRCDQYLFISSRDNSTLPAIKLCDTDDRPHLWCKTKHGMRYLFDNYLDHFDWFLKADDDSYVIVDNLRHFLAQHSPQKPLYFGCKLRFKDVVYMSGGAGYVLSQTALKHFIKALDNNTDTKSCRAHIDTGVEDLEMGRCLQNNGVDAGDARDDWAKARFLPFDPLHMVMPNMDINVIAPWFHSYSVYPHKSGPECCSRSLISFHYVPKDMMYLMDFLLYKVDVLK
ncbi:unnamed protein product [Oppiella nova]|uniref:N-acetylgalactosaminide beta-1,3-galactosyltransferase n=1 Tax=Oppiella nova TaxID=334625 RepID=A0A7R9LXR6_9ACAR|nr:unnamed protein product [Oppiella nova]CAG2167939.1 unnamed protein product [Oppiella nova]